MEQGPQQPQEQKLPQVGDRKEVEGVRYEYKETGYSIREYFSHHTPTKGPGPGWDFITRLLDKEYAMKTFGRTFSQDEVFSPEKLPDTPYCKWTAIYDEE